MINATPLSTGVTDAGREFVICVLRRLTPPGGHDWYVFDADGESEDPIEAGHTPAGERAAYLAANASMLIAEAVGELH